MPFDLTPSLDFLLAQKMDHLTTRQLSVLLVCHESVQTVRDLAAKLGVARSVITKACDKLSNLGFLDRKVDQKDRRSVLISLTSSGKKFARNFA